MLLAALAALTLLRLALAAVLPVIPDEAYYWVWSQALAPGYPDHPPLVALWVRAGTMVAGDTPLGIRLLGPLSIGVASLLLYDAANRLLPGLSTGHRAPALLNATLLFGVGSLLMTPDAPLLTFWIACLWALARLLDSGAPRWWLAAGLFAGLAMLSKYTAALLWGGIAVWLVMTPAMRHWLRNPAPWLGALVGVAVFFPALLWDATHEWVSFARQGGRVAMWQPTRAGQFLGELIAGQFGLITPLAFILCAAGTAQAVRRAWRDREPAWTLLSAMVLPGAVLFVEHAMGDRVQGNWPAIIYPAAAIAAASLTAPGWQRLFKPAVALGIGITVLVYLVGLQALPLPAGVDPTARQLAGWDRFSAEVDTVRREAQADFVAVDQYGVAAELALLLPRAVPVVGVEPRWAEFDLPAAEFAGRSGILVRTGRREGNAVDPPWADAVRLRTTTRRRAADAVETFTLYRVTMARPTADAVLLPRPR